MNIDKFKHQHLDILRSIDGVPKDDPARRRVRKGGWTCAPSRC